MQKIYRLIDWFPVIWKDYDYDYTTLYTIMSHKITRMANVMECADRHLGCEDDVRDMRITALLLRRHQEYNYHKKRHPELCSCRPLSFNENGTVDLGICEYCHKFEFSAQDQKEISDIEYALDLIKKKSRRWWT